MRAINSSVIACCHSVDFTAWDTHVGSIGLGSGYFVARFNCFGLKIPLLALVCIGWSVIIDFDLGWIGGFVTVGACLCGDIKVVGFCGVMDSWLFGGIISSWLFEYVGDDNGGMGWVRGKGEDKLLVVVCWGEHEIWWVKLGVNVGMGGWWSKVINDWDLYHLNLSGVDQYAPVMNFQNMERYFQQIEHV
jgi:hypothetical protein